MAFSRQLGVVSILGACFFLAVGCGDDEDRNVSDGDAGEGGSAGSAGKSTGGSSSGKGGGTTAGSGGDATAGNGGEATAGSANEGGVAGEGGTTTVGGAGAAGEGGTTAVGGAGAGAGGEGGSPVAALPSCTNACEIDSDCAVEFTTTPLVCDQQTHRCVDSLAACETNDNCVPWMSLWYTPCVNQAGCDQFSACVAWEGKGYCAALDEGFCISPPWGEPTTLPEFGKAEPQQVDVCFGSGARCSEGKCIVGCADPTLGSCTGKGDSCNEQTGLCECENGAKCKSGLCGQDAHCVECATDAHCASNNDGNEKCMDGKCGCGSAATCPDETATATPVCE